MGPVTLVSMYVSYRLIRVDQRQQKGSVYEFEIALADDISSLKKHRVIAWI